MNTILIIAFFTFIIHFAEISALSIRLAGIRTKQIATSISFVNISFLIARLSNMFQAPLLGIMVDNAIRNQQTQFLVGNFRLLILAAFLGNLVGAFFLPSSSRIMEKALLFFQKHGSMHVFLGEFYKPQKIKKLFQMIHLPHFPKELGKAYQRLPKPFLYLNGLMVAIYAVGVLASLYAGAMLPELRTTAAQLSGIVNGLATILLALLVDPTGAHLTDQVVHGLRTEDDAKAMIFFLAIGRIIATLLIAQLIFLPAASYIMLVTNWVGHNFH
jgi:hypothetical protein